MTKSVAVLVGSLREGSLNRMLARQLQKLAEGRLDFHFVALGDLPPYNEDLWPDPPAPVTRMKEQIDGCEAVLIVSPEYNRGYPGFLGTAFDWGSRPVGKSSWTGKPVAITGVTKGAVGTAAGQQHLRLAALNLAMVPMHVPESYVTWNDERFAADGSIINDTTRKLLQAFVDAFAAWIDKHG